GTIGREHGIFVKNLNTISENFTVRPRTKKALHSHARDGCASRCDAWQQTEVGIYKVLIPAWEVDRMLRQFRILRLILREMLTRERITRSPERAAMDIEESVEAFHAEGESMGRLRPLYHFNALAMSHLLPPEARLIDLGCGSGQYLLYLAECRPDIQIIGLDVSERMIQLGNRSVERGGFTGRVTL